MMNNNRLNYRSPRLLNRIYNNILRLYRYLRYLNKNITMDTKLETILSKFNSSNIE